MRKKKTQIWWGSRPMPGEDPAYWKIGLLRMWCKSTADELWIAHHYIEAEDALAPEAEDSKMTPEELNWRRWTFKQAPKEIQLAPVFPDLPVVVKPEYPFRVTRGVSTRIYVRVPLWTKILLGKTPIVELPSVVLPKTWFGNFMDGELSYWISSGTRKKIEADPSRPFLAICPIQIINRSKDELLVEKICLRVNQVALLSFEEQLWANETKVIYRGKNETSQIEISRKAPSEAPNAKLVTLPRNEAKKGFTAKTFSSLKDLPGFGFLHK